VPDIVVVGGGIIGAACAYELARAGVAVKLLEKDELAAGASGRNLGYLDTSKDPVLAPLAQRSLERYAEIASDPPTPFFLDPEPLGTLAVTIDQDEIDHLREWVSAARAVGVELERVNDRVRELEPELSPDVLEAYLKDPVPQTTLVMVASDVDRTRKLYKTLQKQSTIVECWGLRVARDGRIDLREVARTAEQMVKQAVGDGGQQIEPAAARLVAERAGTDIARLRGDVERLLLYTAGSAKITLDDARQIVSAETAQDDWAVTNAIQRRDAREALRQLALALDAGGVSYQILGQLAWFVREKLVATDPRRVPAAIEALFRTDLELKSSGDARVLLERLVVQLCRG